MGIVCMGMEVVVMPGTCVLGGAVSLWADICSASETPHRGGTSSPHCHTAIAPGTLACRGVLAKSHSEPEGRLHAWQEGLPGAPGFEHPLLLHRVQSAHLNYGSCSSLPSILGCPE